MSDDADSHIDQIPEWNEPPTGEIVQFPSGDSQPCLLPSITLRAGDLHNIATYGEQALIEAETPFYVRGGRLMRPVVDDLPASQGHRSKVARLADVSEAAMLDHLSRSASWEKWDARSKKYVAADPTPKIASTILSRDGEWSFPKLSGVITTQTIRPNGTLLLEPGYDETTQLLLIDPPEMPKLPAKPSRKAGQKALAVLDRLLDEFPFVDPESRAVALSAIITPIVRGAVPVAPMHVTKAPVAGSGKSYIIDLASALNSGERAPVLSAAAKDEETEKRLVAALLSGQTIISIDNVNGELAGDTLCQIVERPVVTVRPLGTSQSIKVESRASCYATGNNIRLAGDMTRRALLCSLDPDMERPELRTFEHRPFDQIIANRGYYVAAALTVVRSYAVAGYPDQLRPLASFEVWSKVVRSALVWLGQSDPVETMKQAREDDPIRTALGNILASWHTSVGTEKRTASEIISLSGQDLMGELTHPALREALKEVADDRRNGISAKTLGRYLASMKGRVVDGLKITEAGKTSAKQVLWRISSSS